MDAFTPAFFSYYQRYAKQRVCHCVWKLLTMNQAASTMLIELFIKTKEFGEKFYEI